MATTEATVVRIAGGRVHAAMSTLLVLAAVGNNGEKGVIMVVHHTDCGMQSIDDNGIRECLGKSSGAQDKDVGGILEGMSFGSFVR
jgi:carbonic anhydrase